MPVDEQIFFFVPMFQLFLMIMTFVWDEKGAIFAFAGGIIGAWFITQFTDGLITTAYAYTTSFQLNNISDVNLIYIPIFVTLLSFVTAIWKILDEIKQRIAGIAIFIIVMIGSIGFGTASLLSNLSTTSLMNTTAAELVLIQTYLPLAVVSAGLVMMVGVASRVLNR